ncbi:hypothetical protein FI667_g15520, partial [Globisporangium splendens]
MVWRTLTQTLAVVALSLGATDGFHVYVLNRCNTDLDLAHVVIGSQEVVKLPVGATVVREVPNGSKSHVLKAGIGAQATLAELSGDGGSWFDISIIPTGPKSGPEYCASLQACKDLTGGVGFNYPMQISPRTPAPNGCQTVTCLADGCPDAYQFPKDDTKTHFCPIGTDFDVTFCPGGTGGLTPAPTPAPTPSPTSSPTPSLTPTPTPQSNEERGALDSQSGSSATVGDEDPNAEAGFLTKVVAESVSEVAGEATPAPDATSASDAVATGTKDPAVQEVTTRSEAQSSNDTGVYLLSIAGGVAMVAGAAIFAVRKKKQQLDDLNVKTPRDDRATSMGALSILVTPNHEITVL